MGMFDGKKGLILGVANDRSIAWYIAKFIMEQGGVCGFTHLPDKADDDRKKNRMRVQKCIDQFPDKAKFLVPLNVQSDENIAEVMALAKTEFGQIDFMLHSIAFATLDDLKKDTIETSREGFKLAMEISAYSLLAVCNAAKGILKPAVRQGSEVTENGAAVLTLTYYGGERIVPGYNVMGICKAALDSCMKYAAYDLGVHGIRVNALSAGPLKTLAGSAAGVGDMQTVYDQMSPLQRCVTHEEVGRTGAFLLSDMSEGITAETMHVDGGFSEMGSPGRMLDKYRSK
ncbi:enoyl-ACP reductase [Anatilimnocola sp. NA78]|uniref:enoyl-ACP reductase FabI n=1 Tax=Anatilimnocola sp. NA78 TaxID=3415683 RepID=UPI003CE500B7